MSAHAGQYALGIDLGGTNIRAAIVERAGRIIARHSIPTPQLADGHLGLPDDLVRGVMDCAETLLAEYAVIACGMGCGGQFNAMTGVLRGINTGHPAFVDYPLAEKLQDALGLPITIDSDVKTAAYGELRAGAGRDYQHAICVAVGTGIGGALIVDGELFHGATGLAGHLGQIPAADDGTLIEDLAGGVFIGRIAVREGVLQPGATTRDLFDLARNGDDAARALIEQAGGQLGRVLAGLAHTLEPEAILIGGTVGIQPEYLRAIDAGLHAHLMANWRHIPVRAMTLGADAGQIGAGLRAFALADSTDN